MIVKEQSYGIPDTEQTLTGVLLGPLPARLTLWNGRCCACCTPTKIGQPVNARLTSSCSIIHLLYES